MLNIVESWSGGIENLVAEVNLLLPEDHAVHPKDEANARLVRHYTTQGLLAAPTREAVKPVTGVHMALGRLDTGNVSRRLWPQL